MDFKVWRKSTRSQGGNDCVEVSHAATDPVIGLRDSKQPEATPLAIPAADWPALLGQITQLRD